MSLPVECHICKTNYYSRAIHIIAECACTDNARLMFLQKCGLTINQDVQMELSNSDYFHFTCKALGQQLESDIENVMYARFYRLASDFADLCLRTYNAH